MTERIDIKITDGIDGDIPRKLRDIASSAREGYNQINNLERALKKLQSQQVNQLSRAANELETNLLRQLRAQRQLDTATTQAAIADTRAAIEKQRLATATAQAENAQQRAAATAARAAIATNALAAQEERLAVKKRILEAATEAANNAQVVSNNLAKQSGAAMRNQSFIAQNLVYQLNDVAVSLASGQRPLTVLLQQGSQIATMFGPGAGVGGVFRGLGTVLGGLVTKFAGPLAAVGLFATGFAILRSNIEKTSGEAVGFVDVFIGTFQAFGSRIFGTISSALDPVKPYFTALFDFFLQQTQNAIRGSAILWNFIPGLIVGSVQIMANGVSIIYNGVVTFIESATNVVIDGINIMIAQVNALGAVVGQQLADPLERVSFDGAKRELFQIAQVTDLWANAVGKADTGMKGLYEQIEGLAVANKKAREENEKGFNRAEELQKINDALDAQTRSMYLLSDARRVQEQLDQIALRFAQEKKPLDAQELATLRQKLQAIQAYARVQKETDRIVEEATGAQQTYEATLQGADRLLKQNIITQQQYQQQVNAAKITLEQATNPLYDYQQGLANATATLGFFGDELAAQQAVQAAAQQAARRGVDLSAEQVAAMLTEQRTLQEGIRLQQAMTSVFDEATGAQRNYQTTLAAAQALYAANEITLDQYTEAVNRNELALKRANDPLFDFNRGIEEQKLAVATYGTQQAVLNNQLQAYNMLLEQGKTSLSFAQFQQTAYAQGLAATTLALEKQSQVQSSLQAIFNENQDRTYWLDNEALFYAEIKRLRDADLISHKDAEYAKTQVAIAANEQRLNNYRTVANAFVGLSQSGNKKLAAIGKAAAITQATIDGFLAVQKTLATVPPPFNYVAAAGIAATTAVNVANIKAQNAGNYQHGGQFTVDGKAGIDANVVGMSLTKGERVTVETAAQARANDRGNMPTGAAPNVTVPVKVVNVIDPEEALALMQTPEGEAVVLNILRRNPDAVKQAAQGT